MKTLQLYINDVLAENVKITDAGLTDVQLADKVQRSVKDFKSVYKLESEDDYEFFLIAESKINTKYLPKTKF